MCCLSLVPHIPAQMFLSDLVTGVVQLAVCKKMPVDNVSLILGNDLAVGNVFARPIFVSKPIECASSDLEKFPLVFPACAVTWPQSRKFQDVVNLSNSFVAEQPELLECKLSVPTKMVSGHDFLLTTELPSMVGKEHLAAAQKPDPSLVECDDLPQHEYNLLMARVGYFWDDGVLMRK